jgi:uroporphyrinogen-III synthase
VLRYPNLGMKNMKEVIKATTKTTTSTKKVKEVKKPIKSILISQPRPEGDRSPYFELEKKYGVQLNFHPFLMVEGINARDFRKQKIEIPNYSAIIFTSRYAVDHFFRICEELKIKVSAEMKYFCISEAVALYLQKFTLYRKRKVFFGENGTTSGLLKIIEKHKTAEKYIVPSSDINKKDIIEFLASQDLEFIEATLYRTVCNDVTEIMKKAHDMIVFFSPGGVKSLFENLPKFEQKNTLFGAFGPTTCKAIEESGLTLTVKAPLPNAPSMVTALDLFLGANSKKK